MREERFLATSRLRASRGDPCGRLRRTDRGQRQSCETHCRSDPGQADQTGNAGGCQKKLGPGRQIVSQDSASGVSRLGGQAGTQAPDPTPPPDHHRGSRARSTTHTLPADHEGSRGAAGFRRARGECGAVGDHHGGLRRGDRNRPASRALVARRAPVCRRVTPAGREARRGVPGGRPTPNWKSRPQAAG